VFNIPIVGLKGWLSEFMGMSLEHATSAMSGGCCIGIAARELLFYQRVRAQFFRALRSRFIQHIGQINVLWGSLSVLFLNIS